MAKKTRKSISEKKWQAAVDAYELGTKHASHIARDLCVSSSTVSREFKRRGCVKACRVAESIAPLVATLDARDRVKACRRAVEEAANAAKGDAMERLIHGMIKSLVAADRVGSLAAAGPAIEKIRKSLGAKALQ